MDAASKYVILVFQEDWHPGVVGIVAGKLKEHFSRPAFAGTIDPETGKGKASGRSIPGLNLAEMIGAHQRHGVLEREPGATGVAQVVPLDVGRLDACVVHRQAPCVDDEVALSWSAME